MLFKIRGSCDLVWGSLTNNDGNVYKNVTRKVNSRYFKLYRAYSISFNSSNDSEFFWSWILKDCFKVQGKKNKVVVFVHASTKCEIKHFHVVVMQRQQRNVQISMMRMQSCCFAILNLLLFCRSCCRCRCHCLSSLLLPITFTDHLCQAKPKQQQSFWQR